MSSRDQIVQRLIDPGIIAVVRASSKSQVLPVAEALLSGGIIAIEITMTTPHAIEAIGETASEFGDAALIGVGTILEEKTAQKAIDAGAQFVVSPILKPEIVPIAHRAGKPIMLGGYTPSEMHRADLSGCDFVKLFPANTLGAEYIRAVRAPLPHLKIVPTGGVNLKTMKAFWDAGSAALGVGSSLISRAILESNDWKRLAFDARQYVDCITSLRR